MSIKTQVMASSLFESGLEFITDDAYSLVGGKKVSTCTALSRMCHLDGLLLKRIDYSVHPNVAYWRANPLPPMSVVAPAKAKDMTTQWLRRTWVKTPTSNADSPRYC